MVGKIKVRPIVEPGTLASRSFGVRWASRTNKETGTRFDVRYQVGGKWKTWKNDTASFHGTFGKHRRPVRVNPGAHLQDRGALGASEHAEEERLVAGALRQAAGLISGPCAGCGRLARTKGRPPSRRARSRWPLRPYRSRADARTASPRVRS